MDQDEAKSLFRKFDDPEKWEYPQGFDYESAIMRFRRFAEALDADTGAPHTAETGSMIQDASFHSEITIDGGVLRFSNFGNMVSLSPDAEVAESTLKVILRLCQEMGYLYVPSELTEMPYTAANPGVTGIRNWWIRYFDYV